MVRLRWRRVLLGLAVVGLAITGIVLLTEDTAEPDARFENVSDRLAAIDTISATRTTVITRGNETTRTVERVRLDVGEGGVWSRQVRGPGDTDRRISNGTTLWLYDREDNEVTRLAQEGGSSRQARYIERIPALVATLQRADKETVTPTDNSPTGAPLPVVPAGKTGRSVPTPAVERGSYTVTTDETTTVAGRSVVPLAIERRGGEPLAEYRQTLWLDAQWYFPLKTQTAWTQRGQRTVITTTYTDLTVNPPLDPSLFEFSPPPNATVEAPTTPDQQQFDSVRGLRQAAEVSVPEPALPESFVLAEATRTTGQITSVGLRYVNATSVVTVAKIDSVAPPASDGDQLRVAGQPATYRVIGAEASVVWTCGEWLYKVRGSGFPRSTLVSTAESVGCSSQRNA